MVVVVVCMCVQGVWYGCVCVCFRTTHDKFNGSAGELTMRPFSFFSRIVAQVSVVKDTRRSE